jgi:outer membrane lipoprotein SlyB
MQVRNFKGAYAMKKILLAILLLVPLAAMAAPMTNDDVIKMVKGGLGEATVIQAINAAEGGFDTSPDGLVKLKQGGVSDAVIQKILAHRPAAAAAPAPVAPPVCRECGTVTGLREINKPGQGNATGAVAGAVVGGLLGNVIGGHSHRTAGTVVGAAGGAVAGYEIQKHASAGKTWEIGVQFDDGNSRIFKQDTHPGWLQGSRVRLLNGALAPL